MRASTAAALRKNLLLPHTPITPIRSRSTSGLSPRKSHLRAEVLGERFGRGDVARRTTAFPAVGGVVRERDETALGHLLGVEARRLFFDASLGVTHDDRGMLQ